MIKLIVFPDNHNKGDDIPDIYAQVAEEVAAGVTKSAAEELLNS